MLVLGLLFQEQLIQEWPSGLRRQTKNRKDPGARPGLGTQPRYEAPSDLRVELRIKRSD